MLPTPTCDLTRMTWSAAAFHSYSMKMIPVGYVPGPEEIAEAMAFAATNRYTTGTVLDTSGGIVLGRVIPEQKAAFGGQSAPLSTTT